MTALQRYINKSRQRHIFRQFRYTLRFVVAPFYVLFGAVDYIYNKDNFALWLGLRVLFLVSIFVSFELLKNRNIRSKYSELITVLNIGFACNIIALMIWQTGGGSSLYITGLILVSMTGIQINRLDGVWALHTHLVSYLPASAVVLISSWPNNIAQGFVQSAFFIGMTFLAYIFRSSEDQVIKKWTINKIDSEKQLQGYRRTEFMKSHFPKALREMIERNEVKIEKRRVYSNAVVGFVDISGSTTIANTLTLLADWQMKEKFIESAAKRAVACNLTVLSHLGDGFMFLANFNESGDWPLNVLAFYEGLIRDFDLINKSMGLQQGGLTTGLKFGLTMGPSVVGFLGQHQSYFTAMGPDVNLAARLCDKAQANEMIVSSRVWSVLKHIVMGWSIQEEVFTNLKGFQHEIPAVRVKPRTVSDEGMKCPNCNIEMSIGRNSDGFIVAVCPNESEHEQFDLSKKAS